MYWQKIASLGFLLSLSACLARHNVDDNPTLYTVDPQNSALVPQQDTCQAQGKIWVGITEQCVAPEVPSNATAAQPVTTTAAGLLNFLGYCLQGANATDGQQKLVAALLGIAGTQNCNDAFNGLSNQPSLDLSGRGLVTLEALRGLETNLSILVLANNAIVDVSPLAGFKGLQSLNLFQNNVQQIDALQGLVNLGWLNLGNNPVQSLAPMQGQTSLQWLNLSGTPFMNSSSFKNATNCPPNATSAIIAQFCASH